MEIHATTQFTYETYRQYFLFSLFRGKHYKLKQKVFSILITIGFISSFMGLFSEQSDLRFLSFFSNLLCFCSMMFTNFIIPKINYKSQKNTTKIPNDYAFYEDEFRVITNNPQHSETTTIKYNLLYKVYETDESFYLYLNWRLVYPIVKDGISSGEIDELRKRLISHLESKKYIRCK